MAVNDQHWTELVEKSLFERDPAFRQHRLDKAMTATEDRLFEIKIEFQMLLEARRKLRNAIEKSHDEFLSSRREISGVYCR